MMNDHIRTMEEAEAQRAQKKEGEVANAPAPAAAAEPPKRAAMSSSLKPNKQLFGSIKPQAPPQPEANEEEDMEALMMKELLSRSQESPKASKKSAPTFPAAVSAGNFGETKIEDEPEEEGKVEQPAEDEKKPVEPAGDGLKSSELKKSLGVKHTDSLVDDEVEPSAEEADAVAADIANEEEKPAEPVVEATGPVVLLEPSNSDEPKPVVEEPPAEIIAPVEEVKEELKPTEEPSAEEVKSAEKVKPAEEAKPEEEPKAVESEEKPADEDKNE